MLFLALIVLSFIIYVFDHDREINRNIRLNNLRSISMSFWNGEIDENSLLDTTLDNLECNDLLSSKLHALIKRGIITDTTAQIIQKYYAESPKIGDVIEIFPQNVPIKKQWSGKVEVRIEEINHRPLGRYKISNTFSPRNIIVVQECDIKSTIEKRFGVIVPYNNDELIRSFLKRANRRDVSWSGTRSATFLFSNAIIADNPRWVKIIDISISKQIIMPDVYTVQDIETEERFEITADAPERWQRCQSAVRDGERK